ncbi:MAG: hypothetical protein M3176_07030 [Chloroflexota bacterium]|nr:hypothetical protein [Chloroflexota bacterium]
MQRVRRQPRYLFAQAIAMNRPLALTVLIMLLAMLAALVGLVVDPRVITSAPAWLKPLKFAVSISIYAATFIWLLSFIQGHRRVVRLIAWVSATGVLIEMVLIAGQVVRGTTSHFNVGTGFDAAVWETMAVSIVCVWTANLILGIVLLRQRFADAAFAWALRLGVFISFVGMGVAFFMTTPTAAQLTAANAGAGLPVAGAHTIGVADGGPGLPIVGWSTVGGDLRVPHFVGLHALQLLPLLGWLIVRYGARLRPASRTVLVWIAGLGYLGLVGLLTWQALRGQSLVAPDARTLVAAGLLLTIIVGAALVVLIREAGRHATRPHVDDSAATYLTT